MWRAPASRPARTAAPAMRVTVASLLISVWPRPARIMRRLAIRPSVGTTSVVAVLPMKRASAARLASSPESASSSSLANGDHAGASPPDPTGTTSASAATLAGSPISKVSCTLVSPFAHGYTTLASS